MLKKSFVSACYIFSAIIILYSLLVICLYDGMGMNPVSVCLIYPFCFLVALANNILKHAKINIGFKLATHFSLVTLSLILFVYLPSDSHLSGGTIMVAFALYAILYAVGIGIYLALSSKSKRKADKKSEYKNVF